jgi:hypothetical protein
MEIPRYSPEKTIFEVAEPLYALSRVVIFASHRRIAMYDEGCNDRDRG